MKADGKVGMIADVGFWLSSFVVILLVDVLEDTL